MSLKNKLKSTSGLFGLLFKIDRIKIDDENNSSDRAKSSAGLLGLQVKRDRVKINGKDK